MATISNLSIDQGASFSTSVTVNTSDATTTLSAALNNSATTIPVATSIGLPEAGTVKIGLEDITYTGTTTSTLTGATRGANSTTAAAYASGQGVTFTAGALNLTGYSSLGQLRKSYGSSTATAMTTAISNAATGDISITMTDTATAALEAGRYQWDLLITSGSGNKTRVVEGIATINPSVSRS